MNNTDLRSLEVIDFNSHSLPIHIIGMGATGSRVFEFLCNLGAQNIKCYDFDIVEPHNIQNQLWTSIDADAEHTKVEAAELWYRDKYNSNAPDDMEFINKKVTENDCKSMSGIVFLLTDTFESRREIMQGLTDGGKCPLVIETRLATRFNEIRAVNPLSVSDVKLFMDSLGDDDAPDAETSACGTKVSCVLSAVSAANTACWILVNKLTDQIDQQRINQNFQPIVQVADQSL